MVKAEVALADVDLGGNGMDLKNRSMDSVSTFVSQCSSPGVGGMSEDQSSMKSDDLLSVKVKLMCSYGGRIMPRPHDNQLRYVGGETRILVVSRNISFSDLLSKLTRLCGKAVAMKYQLPNEDLDVLVSVTCDEDLDNMMEEFDGMESRDSSCRLRVFLFPVKNQNLAEALEESRNVEQRFLDAVNGMAFASKRQSSSSTATTTHMPDFLFGLDSLANPDRNPVVPPLVTSDSHATFQTLDKSVSERQLPPVDPQPLIASVPLDEVPKDLTDKSVISVLESTSPIESASQVQPSSYIPDLKQPAPSYVPLVEVPQDQLPKGMVLRQYSVESSYLGSLDLPIPKDTSNFANVCVASDPQSQTGAIPDSKDLNPLFAIAEIDSNLSKISQDSAEICKNLNVPAASAEKLLNQRKPEEGYKDFLNVSHPQSVSDSIEKPESAIYLDESLGQHNKIGLTGQDQILKDGEFEFRTKFEDGESVNLQNPSSWLASSEQFQPEHMTLEGQGHQDGQVFKHPQGYEKERIITMQRRASDPAPMPRYHEQNSQAQFVTSNRSNPTAFWQVEDKTRHFYEGVESMPQHFYEGAESVPQLPSFVPRPGLTQIPSETIARVASAPNTMRMANNFAPNYAPSASPSAQLHRQFSPNLPYSGLHLPLPLQQPFPCIDQTVSHTSHTAQSPSRFREPLSLRVGEHRVSVEDRLPRPLQIFKDQFAYNVDPVVDPEVHLRYQASRPQVHYVQNSVKGAPPYKITNPFEDVCVPLPDTGLLEVMKEAQSAPVEGRNNLLQPVMRNE